MDLVWIWPGSGLVPTCLGPETSVLCIHHHSCAIHCIGPSLVNTARSPPSNLQPTPHHQLHWRQAIWGAEACPVLGHAQRTQHQASLHAPAGQPPALLPSPCCCQQPNHKLGQRPAGQTWPKACWTNLDCQVGLTCMAGSPSSARAWHTGTAGEAGWCRGECVVGRTDRPQGERTSPCVPPLLTRTRPLCRRAIVGTRLHDYLLLFLLDLLKGHMRQLW